MRCADKSAKLTRDFSDATYDLYQEITSLSRDRRLHLISRSLDAILQSMQWTKNSSLLWLIEHGSSLNYSLENEQYQTNGSSKYSKIQKARLVARAFTHQYGIDYEETFGPVEKLSSVRMLFALCVENQKMRQFDIKTAFLYGD